MKRTKTLVSALAFGLLGILLQPMMLAAEPVLQAELDALMGRWIEALETEDSDGLLECYWPEAVSISYDPSGGSELLEGTEAIRASQDAVFAEYDYPSLGLEYPEPARFFPRNDRLPVCDQKTAYDNRSRRCSEERVSPGGRVKESMHDFSSSGCLPEPRLRTGFRAERSTQRLGVAPGKIFDPCTEPRGRSQSRFDTETVQIPSGI